MGFIKNAISVAVAGVAAAGAVKIAKRYQENRTLDQVAAGAGGNPSKKETSEIIGDIARATTEVVEEAGVVVLDTVYNVSDKVKEQIAAKKAEYAEQHENDETDEDILEEEGVIKSDDGEIEVEITVEPEAEEAETEEEKEPEAAETAEEPEEAEEAAPEAEAEKTADDEEEVEIKIDTEE